MASTEPSITGSVAKYFRIHTKLVHTLKYPFGTISTMRVWQFRYFLAGLVNRQNTKIWAEIRKIQRRLKRVSQVPRYPNRPRPREEPRADPEPEPEPEPIPSTGESSELTPIQPESESKQESSKSESGADRPPDAATGETVETDTPKLPQPSKTPTRKNTKKAGKGKGERRKKPSRRNGEEITEK